MFKVEYKYSACIKIITDDTRILCDPWFGSSAYEGTWHHFPPVKDTIGLVGDFDLIYVSHIHPDHEAGTDGNLLWKGALSDAGVDGGLRETCCLFDFWKTNKALILVWNVLAFCRRIHGAA